MNKSGLKKILYAVFMGGFMAIGAILVLTGIIYWISFASMAPDDASISIPLGIIAPSVGCVCIGFIFFFRYLYIKEASRID